VTSRKPRGLRAEEKELWQQVARTARPMRPNKKIEEKQSFAPAQVKSSGPAIDHFEIGSKAKTASTAIDRAPTPSLNMDKKTFQRMKRGKSRPEAKIDLHGMTAEEARSDLIEFLFRAQADGKRLVLVVTGKGRTGQDAGLMSRPGVLRRSLPRWVSEAPLAPIVQQTTEAHQRHGGSGAFYVYLRRRR